MRAFLPSDCNNRRGEWQHKFLVKRYSIRIKFFEKFI